MDLVPLADIGSGLGLGSHELIALVGGGGKTTLLHALGEVVDGKTILTTTTKMGCDENGGRPILLDPTDGDVAAADGPTMAWKGVSGMKALGVSPEDCDRWFGLVDHVVVEADGARDRPFKAPAAFEPVVPRSTTLMLSVIGADALGRVILDQCHRPMRVAALASCRPGERLTPDRAATVLLHADGALRAIPAQSRFAVVITKVEASNEAIANDLLSALHERRPDLIVVPVGFESGA
jgi:probable selenium-dependent hydroxylase accessory protein YqeC